MLRALKQGGDLLEIYGSKPLLVVQETRPIHCRVAPCMRFQHRTKCRGSTIENPDPAVGLCILFANGGEDLVPVWPAKACTAPSHNMARCHTRSDRDCMWTKVLQVSCDHRLEHIAICLQHPSRHSPAGCNLYTTASRFGIWQFLQFTGGLLKW